MDTAEVRIENALLEYSCQHTHDHDGYALSLIDVLSPGKTIKEGKLEIKLLAEHIVLRLYESQKQDQIVSNDKIVSVLDGYCPNCGNTGKIGIRPCLLCQDKRRALADRRKND